MVGGEQQCPDLGWAAQAGQEKLKMEQEQDEDEDQPHSPGKEICPPHPGLAHGLCFRCGKNVSEEPESARLTLRYTDEGLSISPEEAARIRREELKLMMLKQKLCLVIDLDHTMLDSALFTEVSLEEQAYVATMYINGLYRVNRVNRVSGVNVEMWIKLRPFAHEFIEEASKICEIHVYTLGDRGYALKMARLLDPTGRFLGDRIISQTNMLVVGAESAVVILDDTEEVWPKHRANLVLLERYHFFKSNCIKLRFRGSSLTERERDESESEGALAMALKILRLVHHDFFKTANLLETGILRETTDHLDVTKVIQSLRGKVLNGCRVVLENLHGQVWQDAAELGALCSTVIESSTTHVISFDRGMHPDKAFWVRLSGTFLVHPRWLQAAKYLWRRQNEVDFVVGNKVPPPYFAKTVPARRKVTLSSS